jgi:hypothetical protein
MFARSGRLSLGTPNFRVVRRRQRYFQMTTLISFKNSEHRMTETDEGFLAKVVVSRLWKKTVRKRVCAVFDCTESIPVMLSW